MAKVLMIVRDCCTSGNCIVCMSEPDHVYGEKVKCCQFITRLPTVAELVKKNFKDYNSEILEATPENIAKLNSQSQEWVREKAKELSSGV